MRAIWLAVAIAGAGLITACKDSVGPDHRGGPRTVASLSCEDASAPGGFVSCKLTLTEPAGYKVVLQSTSCEAHGNLFRITEPVVDTLTTDGCYEPTGLEIMRAGPYPAGTEISAEVVAPLLQDAPRLKRTGQYPEWTLEFEDGVDQDFNDLVMILTALPAN